MNFYGRVLQESYVPDDMARARVRRLYEADQGERPNCEACGQWYVGRVRHECDPRAPLQASYKLTNDNWKLGRAIRNRLGFSFDSGAGGGVRDWQFEMLNAPERLAVAEALARSGMPHTLRFHGGRRVAVGDGRLVESGLYERVVLTEAKGKAEADEKRMLAFMKEEGIGVHAARAGVGLGVSASKARRILDRLVKKGLVEIPGGVRKKPMALLPTNYHLKK